MSNELNEKRDDIGNIMDRNISSIMNRMDGLGGMEPLDPQDCPPGLLEASGQNPMGTLISQLAFRDVLLKVTTINNAYDRGIIEKVIAGKTLDKGEWAHIMDESVKLNLTERQSRILQKIYMLQEAKAKRTKPDAK